MDLSGWGVPIATYVIAAGPRSTMVRWGGIAMLAVAIGTAGWVLSHGGSVIDNGNFLLPCFFGATGTMSLLIDRAGRRQAEAVGDGWYVQRVGVYGSERGFHLRDVVRVRTSSGAYLRGRYVVLLVVETSAGQRFSIPTAVEPGSAALRSELARQLRAANADVDPAAEAVLETLTRAGSDPLGADAGLSRADQELRLDEAGRLRWPRGTFQLACTGVVLLGLGMLSAVLAVQRSGVFSDPTDPSTYLWVALFLVGGALTLGLLWRQRRRDLARWGAQRDASSTASPTDRR